MVNMASSVDRMCVRPTMTMLHNMGAILQLKPSHAAKWFNRTYMNDIADPCHGQ